jgi:hypothetical protein
VGDGLLPQIGVVHLVLQQLALRLVGTQARQMAVDGDRVGVFSLSPALPLWEVVPGELFDCTLPRPD